MGKMENPYIKKYLYESIPEKLNSNPIFVKIFGKDFAERKIRENISIVYTNEYNESYSGYYTSENNSITLCFGEEGGKLFDIKDVQNNKFIEDIALHECIHAILAKNERECEECGVSVGSTGLHEFYYDDAIGKWSEFGRGLNEGFTEWLSEKVGGINKTYLRLTNFIRLIEAAIGTEKTMELGKGNVRENLKKILNITKEEANNLIGNTDHVYTVEKKIRENERLVDLLKAYINNPEDPDIQKKYQENIEKIEWYKNSSFYKARNGQQKSDKILLSYLEEGLIPEQKREVEIEGIAIESFLLSRYFKKEDLDAVFNEEEISDENFKKVTKLVSFLNTNIEAIPEHERRYAESIAKWYGPMNSVEFRRRYDGFSKRYAKQMASKMWEKYNEGELSIIEFIRTMEHLYRESEELLSIFNKEFITNIDPEFRDDFLDRLSSAAFDIRRLIKIVGKSMYKVYSENPEEELSSTIFYNENYYNIDSKEDRVEFEFIQKNDNEYSVAMKNFEKLKEEVFEECPTTRIYIDSRDVVVNQNGNLKFYKISDGRFIPMKIDKKLDVKFSTQSEEKRMTVVPVKENFLSKIVRKIRNVINRNNKENNKEIKDYSNNNENNEETEDYSDVGKISFEPVKLSFSEKYKVDIPGLETNNEPTSEKQEEGDKDERI